MTSNPAELYQQAQRYMHKRDYDGAEKCYRMLISLLPDVPQPHFELADLLSTMGKNPALIINHYEMFIQLAGDNPDLGEQINHARQAIYQLLNPAPLESALTQVDAKASGIDLPDDRIIVDRRGNGHFKRLGDAVTNNPKALPIHLLPGRYNETIMITNPDLELQINGPSSGEPAILMSTSDHCLYTDCLNVEIRNLTISNSSPKAAVQVVGGRVAFEGCEFLECTTVGINVQYQARLELKEGNVFFGGGTALRVADQANLEVGSVGPNYFYSNLRGSIHAAGDSKVSIHAAGFNYRGDLVPEETCESLPYYGLGDVPLIWLQGNVAASIKDTKLTGWGTLIQVDEQASVTLSSLESKAADGFSKQACTPEIFLSIGDTARAEIETSTFSTDVIGASGIVCSGQAKLRIKDLTFGGEITMLKLNGGVVEVKGLNHEDSHGSHVVGLQADGGHAHIRKSYLPFVDILADLEANFTGVRFGRRGAKGSAFRVKIRFEDCAFSGSSHFNGQIDLLNCKAQNLYGSDAWLSFYNGKVRIKGGKFLNHAIAVGCNFDITEASFRFDEGHASPEGVVDILQGAFGNLERCSISSSLPKTYPALRIHRKAKVRQTANQLQGKVKMYR